MNESFSIAICTYRRHQFVELCLKELSKLMLSDQIFPQVMVIDNDSASSLSNKISKYLNQFDCISYYVEPKIGLSHGRNLAVEKCQTKYLAFIDDDAYPEENYLKTLKYNCDSYDYDVIGGIQIPYSDQKIPKWFISNSPSNWASGFNIVFKIESVLNIGGFHPELGMKGKSIGYGEEILPQVLIKKNEGSISIDPNLIVYHYIHPFKLKKFWQLKSSYAHGRDRWVLFGKSTPSIGDILYLIKKLLFPIKVKLFTFHGLKSFLFEVGKIIGGIKLIFKSQISKVQNITTYFQLII